MIGYSERAVGIRPFWGRMLILSGCFVLGVLLTYSVLRITSPPVTSVELHNAGGRTLGDRVSEDARVVLLGSSRMFFGISEEKMSQDLGVPVVNASLTAMRLQEMNEVLDFYLDRTPASEIYLIELLSPDPEPYSRTSSRQTAWYSMRSTRMLVAATWSETSLPTNLKWEYTSRHLRLFALRSRLFGAMTPDPQPVSRTPARSDDSWRNTHQEVLDEVLNGQHRRRYMRSRIVHDFYVQMISKIRSHGINPVFVVLPQVYDNDFDVLPILKSYVWPYPVIDLGTPRQNQEFYNQEFWQDPYHIGGEGAARLSAKLASGVKALNLLAPEK